MPLGEELSSPGPSQPSSGDFRGLQVSLISLMKANNFVDVYVFCVAVFRTAVSLNSGQKAKENSEIFAEHGWHW